MSRNKQTLAFLALTFALAGCGAGTVSAPLAVSYQASTSVETKSIPPASAFKTISAQVKTILPEDNVGLPHQNFVVVTSDGQVYEVNNDTKYGSKVAGLKVGLALTIKGTTYKDTHKQGIHWTHKANVLNDAGWIKTPDGTVYQ